MAKGKSKTNSGGPHKHHGPKKHMFREYGAMKWQFGAMGMLKKEYDQEAKAQSDNAKAVKK